MLYFVVFNGFGLYFGNVIAYMYFVIIIRYVGFFVNFGVIVFCIFVIFLNVFSMCLFCVDGGFVCMYVLYVIFA